MIPDKIYLPKEEIEDRMPWIATPYEDDPNWDECYIRKDALLEWATMARNKLEVLSDNDAVRWGQRNAFQQMIDKLNKI